MRDRRNDRYASSVGPRRISARSIATASVKMCVPLLLLATVFAADDNSLESMHSNQDVVLTTNPASSFWREARAVYAEKDRYGKPLTGRRTEIRSRWTQNYLYFLFVCPYETLYLKPSPNTSS